ncbi:MAG: DUF5706 domain-containing protein [Planctomycetaceae bacterium]
MDEKRLEHSWNVHCYVNEYLRFADAKAFGIVAWTSTVIGAIWVSGVGPHVLGLRFSRTWTSASTLEGVLGYGAFLSLFIGFALSAWCIKPRLFDPLLVSRIFFGGIAKYKDGKQYSEAIRGCSLEILVDDVAQHCHVLSKACVYKYRFVYWGFVFALMGSVFSCVLWGVVL